MATKATPVGRAEIDHAPGEIGREHRHLALREIHQLRRLVDHHQRERHDRVDAAEGEAGSELMQRTSNQTPSPQ